MARRVKKSDERWMWVDKPGDKIVVSRTAVIPSKQLSKREFRALEEIVNIYSKMPENVLTPMVIDCHWFSFDFMLLYLLIHRVSMASLWSSRDLHLPQRDLGISMGSPVAIEPSKKGLPSRDRPRTTKLF
ncbi:MAG: hypothetical protein RQ885_05675 [Desulfurococcales archaeon]|jgi:hypothetical protein|nr:hypothetical protein [Desulfurococcales archaeon]